MMSSVYVVVAITALFFSLARTTHFRGFTMSVQPVGMPGNDSGTVRLTFRISWRRSSSEGACNSAAVMSQSLLGSPVKFRCLSNNCGSQLLPFTLEYVCTSFSADDDWSSGTNEITFSFPFSKGKEFVIGNNFDGTYDCCHLDTNNNYGEDIRFLARFSFESRPNNASVINRSNINHSPVTDVLPILWLARGCYSKINIAMFDPDGDDVKCRWARSSADPNKDECGSACFEDSRPTSTFNATLLEEECVLKWTPIKSGLTSVAIQLEDFFPTDLARTSPLSSVPLQWYIDVVDTGAPCWSRPIFPKQVHIPRDQRRCFAVKPSEALTLEILMEHSDFPNREVVEAAYAFPRGMSASDLVDRGNGTKSVTFAWSPDMDQGNRSYLMCFQLFDDKRAPSNQVCFALVTSTEQPKPILNTRNTTFLLGGKVAPRVLASITFSSDVKNPTVGPRYISVYHVKSGALIQQIDSFNKSLVSVSADSRTVFFEIKAYLLRENYEIVFEEGVVVGASAFFSGGGPVAQGIFAGEWDFILLSDHCVSVIVTCNESSVCIRTWKGVRCQCKNVFEEEDGLTRCDDVDECLSHIHNCHKHAECQDTLGNFTCTCRSGYSGDGIECEDMNECTSGLDDCHQYAICRNTLGSFECICEVGFSGSGSTCVDVNECSEQFHNCDANAYCINTIGSFTCTCQSGFAGDGIVCSDVDECTSGSGNCPKNANCNNTLGSYHCVCEVGFSGNGSTCVDVNECSEQFHNCDANAYCINTIGSFTCTCQSGFAGDGIVCSDVDECTSGSGNCPKNANCNNTLGSYHCVCQVGFSGNGSACLDVNECNDKLDFQCDDLTQHCINTNGGYDCACNDGHRVDSFATTAPSRPVCLRWGICSNVTGTLECACLSGLARSGEICVDIDECSTSESNNCHQYADCLNTFRSYKCQCIDGYPGNGTYCEVSSSSSFPMTTTVAVIVSVFVLVVLFIAGICTYRHRRKLFSRAGISFDLVEVSDNWEINRGDLMLLEQIGKGFFGMVFRAKLYHSLGQLSKMQMKRDEAKVTVVACKVLKETYHQDSEADFFEEIELMKKIGRHQHIVGMLACITQSQPFCLLWSIVAEAIYLTISGKAEINEEAIGEVRNVDNVQVVTLKDEGKSDVASQTNFTALDLLSFTWQISSGMEYLTGRGVVHRDLACRNVLVCEDNLLKVSDFGLARAVYHDGIYSHKTARRLPFRWMSIEAIQRRDFSQQTDVWSFGVAMWEVFTLGNFPYPCVSSRDLLQYLNKGNLLSCPGNCSEELYATMLNCWNADPEKRPTFSHLSETLSVMLEEQNPSKYLDLEVPFWELDLTMESEDSGSESVEDGN